MGTVNTDLNPVCGTPEPRALEGQPDGEPGAFLTDTASLKLTSPTVKEGFRHRLCPASLDVGCRVTIPAMVAVAHTIIRSSEARQRSAEKHNRLALTTFSLLGACSLLLLVNTRILAYLLSDVFELHKSGCFYIYRRSSQLPSSIFVPASVMELGLSRQDFSSL
ncbi:unnamed protein product [Pleuronectes platessa]|uniref:Uncharacterized protein n=1 Tax=Pleuronectes platessa TaxID=8262 RepID=A0A9N7VR65_PLEPL|nr:unnamed protein product [Pleuronectes platessa]